MEVDDENPTIDHVQEPRQIIGVRLNKAPKTAAERGREYRARKALLRQQNKQQQKPDAIVEIATEDIRSAGPSEDNQPEPSEIRTIDKRAKSAEATRRWRERKKGFRESSKKQAKTAAQRMREYRRRKKLFPNFSEPYVLNQWIESTGRQNWEPKKGSRLCSKHFLSSSILRKGCKTYLHSRAVPIKNEQSTENADAQFDEANSTEDEVIPRKRTKRQSIDIYQPHADYSETHEVDLSHETSQQVDDECEILTKLWARKLKKLPEDRRENLIYQINNLLYKECIDYHGKMKKSAVPAPVQILKEELSDCYSEGSQNESKLDEESNGYMITITKTEPEDEDS